MAGCSSAGKKVVERPITDDVRTRVDLPDMELKKDSQYVIYVEGVADGSAQKLQEVLVPLVERVSLTANGTALENNLSKQKNTIYSDSYTRGAAIAAFKAPSSGSQSISVELSGNLRDLKDSQKINKVVVRESATRQSSSSLIIVLLGWVVLWFLFSRITRRRRMQRGSGPPQPGGQPGGGQG
ncbi:MAG: hypothetical protein HY677_02020 [Chloroflexi bacterium]|nr:hypothetical protein [Chloroflexota bacterium]